MTKPAEKRIPLGKQQCHQATRRAAKNPLFHPESFVDEDRASSAEFNVVSALIHAERKSFKKRPDAPLGAVLKGKNEQYVPPWQGGDRLGLHREILDPRKRSLDRS
jgi:hypothetical protein